MWPFNFFSKQDEGGPMQRDAPRIWSMPTEAQQQLAQTKCTLRIVLRGARGVGKTAMLHRLQGKPMPVHYQESLTIAAASIVWHSQHADADPVKVEIWDVVDKGVPVITAQSTTSLSSPPPSVPRMPIDSTTVDVYRGCDAAFFILDVTRRETLDYVRRELSRVPRDVLVLLFANFCDVGGTVVQEAEIASLCKQVPPAGTPFVTSISEGVPDTAVTASAVYVLGSMATGHGLRALHTYLHVPYSFHRIKEMESKLRREYESLHKSFALVENVSQRYPFPTAVFQDREDNPAIRIHPHREVLKTRVEETPDLARVVVDDTSALEMENFLGNQDVPFDSTVVSTTVDDEEGARRKQKLVDVKSPPKLEAPSSPENVPAQIGPPSSGGAVAAEAAEDGKKHRKSKKHKHRS